VHRTALPGGQNKNLRARNFGTGARIGHHELHRVSARQLDVDDLRGVRVVNRELRRPVARVPGVHDDAGGVRRPKRPVRRRAGDDQRLAPHSAHRHPGALDRLPLGDDAPNESGRSDRRGAPVHLRRFAGSGFGLTVDLCVTLDKRAHRPAVDLAAQRFAPEPQRGNQNQHNQRDLQTSTHHEGSRHNGGGGALWPEQRHQRRNPGRAAART